MIFKKNIIKILVIVATTITTLSVHARVVELTLPFAPGGTADELARIVLPILKNELNKTGIAPVINFKPGGGTTIGTQAVARTEPGKIQMLLTSNSIVQAPIVNNLPGAYDLNKDFQVLGYLGHLPMIMAVSTATDIQNFKEFQTQCRQGKLSYGTGGIGTASHIVTAIISSHAGCDAPAGHHKGLGPMFISLAGNHVNYGTGYLSGMKPLLDSNKLKPILIFGRQRLPEYPDVPTIREVGIDVQLENWFIVAVNSTATPEDRKVFQQAVTNTLASKEIQDRLRELGFKNINAQVPSNFLVVEQNNFIRVIKNVNLDTR
jgi:tripartite-type tricarboxylate transporter receptor subunit TctC